MKSRSQRQEQGPPSQVLIQGSSQQDVSDELSAVSSIAPTCYTAWLAALFPAEPNNYRKFDPNSKLASFLSEQLKLGITFISRFAQIGLVTSSAVVNAFGNGPIEQEIADLLEWLSIFDANSIVECDYGGLAIYLEKSLIENGQPGLNADTSIEDVARSLAGLAAGDGALAGQGYERLVTRWRRVAAFEQAM